MKIKITKKYYKRSRSGEEPIRYRVSQPGGIKTTIHAVIRMDPVLRKNPDLRRAMLRHETNEIRAWGQGNTRAHSEARRREPTLTRKIGGVSGFWKEIKRRRNVNLHIRD